MASTGSLPLGDDSNVLIPRFGWVQRRLMWAMALNRVQNALDLYFIDVNSGKSQAHDVGEQRCLDRHAS